MYLPEINHRSVKRTRTDKFLGINRSRVAGEGELYDALNLSSRHYPALCTAPQRYELDSYEVGEGTPLFFCNGDIYHIAGMRPKEPNVYTLYKGGKRQLDFMLDTSVAGANIRCFNSKTLIVKGEYAYELDPKAASPLTGFFDMGYTLTVEPLRPDSDYGDATLAISVLYDDMTQPGSFVSGTADADFPTDAQVGDIFARYLEYYRLTYKDAADPSKNLWEPVTSVRLRLDVGDGYRRFKAGDYVELSSLKYWNWAVRDFRSLDRFIRIEAVDDERRYITEAIPVFDSMNIILQEIKYPSNDIGYGDVVIDNTGNLLRFLSGSVSARMPRMDLICTGANRLWGCSSEAGEIYASELGNARNFSVFEGLSGDSYAVTVGSEGNFTACCNYLGSPVFFKESEMIVISGTRPQSFTLNSYSVRGVPRHSPDGLCVAGDTLYYISNDGFYAYDGSSAVCISHGLGDEVGRLRSCVICGEGDMLYVSALLDGKPVQYIYDIRHSLWHRAETDRVTGYITYPDATLAVCCKEGQAYLTTLGGSIPRDYPLTGAREIERLWHWESGDISYSTDKKYLRRLSIDSRCSGVCRLLVSYDGGRYCEVGSFAPHERGGRRITLFPKRCDSFRIRMEGEGDMTLYAIEREVEEVREDG